MKKLALHMAACSLSVVFLAGCGPSGNPAGENAATPTPGQFTGQVHEVKMHAEGKTFVYDPAELTVKSGDKVRFVFVDGGPHNVNFAGQQTPAGSAILLESQGKLLQAPGSAYEVWFTKDMPTGEYNFVCDAHAAFHMKGKVIVTP